MLLLLNYLLFVYSGIKLFIIVYSIHMQKIVNNLYQLNINYDAETKSFKKEIIFTSSVEYKFLFTNE